MKTVLTVDDSKVVRSMVARHLKDYGCRVVEAADGKEGIEEAKREKPDLILLDITMPVMDGCQTLAELRKDAACKSIPVIMLTAESGREMVLQIAKLGVKGYIVKPFQKETFDKEVSKVLGEPGSGQVDAPVDGGTAMVVDDSERVLNAAKAALEKTFKVLTVASGKEAVTAYKEARPGVVVIDLAMPEMDGFQTLAQLKSLGRSRCLALAVRGDNELHKKARSAGFASVVSKPFQAGELLEQVVEAAAAVRGAGGLLDGLVGDENGCPVISFPPPDSKVFRRIGAELGKKMRELAEEGADRVVLDISQAEQVNADVIQVLTRVISAAEGLGMNTVVCSEKDSVISSLQQIAELSGTKFAPSREAACQSLG